MATNSASSKTWCVTLVFAVVVIIADKGKPDFRLDVCNSNHPLPYARLLLSRAGAAVSRCLQRFQTATGDDLFFVAPRAGIIATSMSIVKAFGSIATWPFYGLLALMLIVVRAWVL